ncbi:TPA: phage terminase small subunit [Pseudomonas aeruginosa]
MSNPCRRHFQRVTAAIEAAAAAPGAAMENATGYELQLAKLQQDQFRLKQVQSQEGKAKLKAELLPDYEPWVDGVLSAGQGAQDDVLVTVMLWRFDAGDFVGGLTAAGYVLQYGLKMPDRFNRTTGCVVAEEVAEAALKAIKAGGTFDIGILRQAEGLTTGHDMPDEARAKLMLAIGRLAAASVEEAKPAEHDRSNLDMAKQYLGRAIELHGTCGGKKDLERVERLLKKHAGSAS